MPFRSSLVALVLAATLAAAEAPPPEATKAVTLTADPVEELRRSGTLRGAGARNAGTFAGALRVSGEAEAVRKKHGFADATESQRVGYPAALAYGVARNGGTAAMAKRLDGSRAPQEQALAAVRAQRGPAQAKRVEAQLAAANAPADAVRDVPDANVALMEKCRARTDALSRR